MIKTFWNEEDYNTITDGAVKYINGAGIFIPYMHGIKDDIYKKYIKELLKLDWMHYKLYLVGGVLEGWPTTDIDICVTGKKTPQLPELMLAAKEIGPFDMYWVKSLKRIKGNGTRIWKFAKAHDRWGDVSKPWEGKWKSDGLFHMTFKFPVKENRIYKKEPLLIN
jgi:hypothetical protein